MEDRRPSAAEIIDRLGGNPRTGRCACPAHDDTEPSLDVREGDHAAMWILSRRVYPGSRARRPTGAWHLARKRKRKVTNDTTSQIV